MSGTGNTAHAASVIAKGMNDAGWRAQTAEIRKGVPMAELAADADLLILCFPVLGFGMPALVRTSLRGIKGNRRKAAIFATWGGEPGAALLQARWFLGRHGFRVVCATGAAYPFQWTQMMSPPKEDEARETVASGDEEAWAFAKALLEGRPRSTAATNPLSVLLGLLVAWLYTLIGRHGLGAMYAADERCKACGNCVPDCPAGVIEIAGTGSARRPRWRFGCQGCNRCINLCRRQAVQVSPLRTAIHLVLNVAVVAAIVNGLNCGAAALGAFPGTPALTTVAYIIILAVLIVLESWLQFVVLEPLLFWLESIPFVRKAVAKS